MGIFQFGETIPNLKIDGKEAPYPVLNERDARAGAGLMLAVGIIAFMFAFFEKYYLFIDVTVILFVLEFSVRLINPNLAPFYSIGKLTVKRMRPEYTGAAQKRFAWALGLAMALTVAIMIYGFEIRGIANLTFCLVCLMLMWLESSFGICLGCKMYYSLMNLGLIKKPEIMPTCPGGACPIPSKKN